MSKRYPATPAYLLAALEDVQTELGWVPEALVGELAAAFHATPAQLESLLAMPGVFRLSPPAGGTIGVCAGAVCSARGGEALFAELCRMARGTDVRVEKVFCQGCCDSPPVAVCGGQKITGTSAEEVWQVARPGG